MTHGDALQFSIERISERIEELGKLAAEMKQEGFASSDDREEWAALRSAQGGMMECLDLMQQAQAIAKSFDHDLRRAKLQ